MTDEPPVETVRVGSRRVHSDPTVARPITAPETAVLSTSEAEQTVVVGPPAAAETGQWVAEISVDPFWYQGQQTTHQLPDVGPPVVVVLRQETLLIGRRSFRQQIEPDLDCSSDPGVSRRHAQIVHDGSRWFIEDLGSSNGTFVANVGEPLPDDTIEPGGRAEVGPTSRIFVGAWTRIMIRPATPAEIG